MSISTTARWEAFRWITDLELRDFEACFHDDAILGAHTEKKPCDIYTFENTHGTPDARTKIFHGPATWRPLRSMLLLQEGLGLGMMISLPGPLSPKWEGGYQLAVLAFKMRSSVEGQKFAFPYDK